MRTKHLRLCVAVILMSSFGARVGAEEENTLPRKTTAPSVDPSISQRSTLRDPFWPVGFIPIPKAEASKKDAVQKSRIRKRLL
jgi:hypothetical protein